MTVRLALLAALLALASFTDAATLTGRVVSMADGDTITVLDFTNDQHKVRLAGIDHGIYFRQRVVGYCFVELAGDPSALRKET